MKKKKQSCDIIKRYSANTPLSSFGIKSNLNQNIEMKMDGIMQHEIGVLTNISSSFEDNSQYYDQFLQTLQKSSHIKHKKTKEKRSSPIQDIQTVETNQTKKINKKENSQRSSLNLDNKIMFSLNTNNIFSNLNLNPVKVPNPNYTQSKHIKLLDSKNDILPSPNKENVKLETIINSNALHNKTKILNNNEEENQRMSKTIQINSNSNNSPIKHSKTGKISLGNNSNIQSNPLETCPIQRKKPKSVKSKNGLHQRNWCFCCLPIK